MRKILVALLSVLLLSLIFFTSCDKIEQALTSLSPEDEHTPITIGTGSVTGVYFSTGGAISRMINQNSEEYGMKVTVESTSGSVFNVDAIISRDIHFGIIQSDKQYQAYHGLDQWQDDPQEKLRAVFSIHSESISVLAADDSGIYSIEDIEGQIINLGSSGSGSRSNAIDAFKAFDLDYRSVIKEKSLPTEDAPKALQDGLIDAYFFTVGHPNSCCKETMSGARSSHFVEIAGPQIDAYIEAHPYFTHSTINMNHYLNSSNTGDVNTFAVKATLCTSVDESDDTVYAITKEVFENFEEFKALHPAYADLEKEDLLEGLTAPIHSGAMKYYKEAGLIL